MDEGRTAVSAVASAAADGNGAGLLGAGNAVVILGIVGLVLFLQFRARRVRAVAFVWVALLVGRGLLPPGPARTTAAGLAFLAVGLVVSAVFGWLRGRTMPLWRDRDGVVWRRGDSVTLRLWLLTIGARFALTGVEYALFHEPFDGGSLLLGLGLSLAVQQMVLMRRGRALTPGGTEPRGGLGPAGVPGSAG
ncbi:hypothetical protein [Streptomyces mobaraensis]|uniref:DUF1453 family protein n=1 Tax=Streptomyces mobaraensis TaxID=35621 RepID=A0A5N5W8P5_STRMB|nr:hypothetical protein [Streptomyces mobaraensis]KAB7844338.1 hypothetical protein FRZ00_15630 [Streptomyces mobaraensis]